MDVVGQLRERVAAILGEMAARRLLAPGLDVDRLGVEPCRDAARGDLVVGAALAFGAGWRGEGAGQGTVRLAEALAVELARDADVARVSVADPGFLNVTLAPHRLAAAASTVLAVDPEPSAGRPGAAVSLWVAPPRSGPPDPANLDHGRAAVVADALGRLLAGTGNDVAIRCDPETPEGRDSLGRLGVAVSWASDDASRVRSAPDATTIEVWPSGTGRSRVGLTERRPGAVLVPVAACRVAPGPDAATQGVHVDGSERDALRFAILCRGRLSPLDLDPAVATDRSHAGPLFNVRYAHARGARMLRVAGVGRDGALSRQALGRVDLAGLAGAPERELLRWVAFFPHAVERAIADHEPQRLAALLRDVAGAVHRQWNRSKDQPQLRFVNEQQRDLTQARLGLMMASTIVLKSGLGLFGITAPDEMR